MAKKIEVTQEEWDKMSDEFARRHADDAISFRLAMEKITRYMNQYKIVKNKK